MEAQATLGRRRARRLLAVVGFACVGAMASVALAAVGADVDASRGHGHASRTARPDLAVKRGSAALVGSRLRARVVVINNGRRGASRSTLSLAWQADARRDRVEVGRRRVTPLKARKRRKLTLDVAIPDATAAGEYSVWACADGRSQVAETSERNNCRKLGSITVAEPQVPSPTPTPEPPAPSPTPASGPLDTTITAGPSDTVSTRSAQFTFSSTGAASWQCQLDANPWVTCSSPAHYASLADGAHKFAVRGLDGNGRVEATPAAWTWTVDATAPETTVSSGPAGPTASSAADFAFHSSEPGSSFECRLDASAWSGCSTPTHLQGLSEAAHTFEVRATDGAGNVDPTPATRPWRVDVTPPHTAFTSGPEGLTAAASADFTFSSSEPTSSFQCRLDGGSWSSCLTPHQLADLEDGQHTFETRAIDAAGNVDPAPAARSWTVDTMPPDTSATGPSGDTPDGPVDFSFSTVEPGSTFECRVDQADFAPCVSPFHLESPTEGPHTFEARAIDPAGNTDPTPALVGWTTLPPPDTTAPSVPSGLAPEARDGAVKVSWNAVQDTDLSQYRVWYATAPDGQYSLAGTTSASETSLVVGGLTNGVTYWFSVSAVDTSANDSSRSDAVSAKPEKVGSVSHCGALATDETWAAGTTHALTCTVVVPFGTTLTLEPGAIVKAGSGAQLLVRGSLAANGTSAQPITLTSVRDDSVGGDYNGDGSDSAAAPNDWRGVDSSASRADQPPSIALDHVNLRYAGLDVNSGGDDRDDSNFVARTASVTNSTFAHGSWLRANVVGPVTVTGNTVANVGASEIDVVGTAIGVTQSGYRSPTTVSSNAVAGASSYGIEVRVRSESTVSPVVRDNAVSNTELEPVSVTAERLVPSNLSGNSGATSTRQGLRLDGRLAADLALPYETLPLVIGGSGLTVGDGVKLTIAAGVVVKSYGGALSVAGGSLTATGSAGSPVVFTSVRDDSAGGDYNGDGGSETPAAGDWSGISTSDSADHPASASLDRVNVRYAGASLRNSGDDRDDVSYVARTTSVTNSSFSHGSWLDVDAAGPIVVTGNTVSNVGSSETDRVGTAIDVRQSGFLSPTTVSSNSVRGASSYGVNVSVRPESTVSPHVRDNAVSNSGLEPVAVTASQLVPANMTGNTGTATTRRGLLLSGTLVADLQLPFETLPVTVGFPGLTVGDGARLSIAAGVVVKSYRDPLSVAGGTLVASGTPASPVVFTAVTDDTAGGDYNKDGDVTVPSPGDWFGISSSDSANHPGSVSLDHVSVRYAGVALSNSGDDRDAPNYLPRTTSVTNSTFSHGSSLFVSAAGPVTVTGNLVSNTGASEISRTGDGIHVRQDGYLSSTTVSSNIVSGAASYGVSVFIQPASTQSPVVQNNAVSNTVLEPVSVASARLIPANLTGNTGAASTRRGLRLEGTLVADLSLPFESLPVTIGASGIYGGLTVGDGAKLSIAPGVVVKSYRGQLSVAGGTLVADGTAASPVVFTAVPDDTAGGDYNKDGNVSSPSPGDWFGIWASDSADHPASVSLDHVSVRYAGVSLTNAGDDRDDPNYLPRTTAVTNSSFSHGSSLWVDAAGPVSVTGNTVTNLGSGEVSRVGTAIDVRQSGRLSPTTVASNTVSGASSYGVHVVTSQTDVERAPVVQSNAVSNAGLEAVSVHSELLVPGNLTGNTGTASTRKGLLLSGTLADDMSLPFGSLPLVLGIGCCSSEGPLAVPEGVTLSIAAGTIVKSNGGGINVAGGSLVANGTAASPVIFTSVTDDTIGGDYNRDGTVTTPVPGIWSGLSVGDVGSLSITGGRIHYASTAISSSGAAATFRGKLTNNNFGATGVCGPFFGTPVDARNVDWGTPTGPWPYGTGDAVNECVLVQPWVGQTVYRARYWGGAYGSGGWAGSAYGSYSYAHRYGGDPVDVATGNFSIAATDISVPEPGPALVFARAYNSQSNQSGMLGPKWTSSWDTRLELAVDSPLGTYDVHWGDGRIDSFTKQGDGSFAPAAGNFSKLRPTDDGGYAATTTDGVKYVFASDGALDSVVDRHANKLTVDRDASARVRMVTDEAGRRLTFAYASGKLTSVTGPDDASYSFGYSAAGDLAQVTDPTGATVLYGYDSEHQLLTAIDAEGTTVLTNVYDLNGRVTSQTDAAGAGTTFAYDPANARTTKTDPRGGQRTYTFDANGQIASESDPTGGATTTTYTPAGLPFRVTDADGRVTSYAFDGAGNLLSLKDPAGKTTSYAYNELNLPTRITDANGDVTELSYDAAGALTSSEDGRQNTTQYGVDARGLRISTSAPSGAQTTYGHDAAGNLTSTTNPLGHATSQTFDESGRILTSTNPLGATTSMAYNARGDLIKVTDPLGNATTTTWDKAGRKTAVTDAQGHTARWTYTATGLVATTTDPNGATTSLSYDDNGNLTASSDPTGVTTAFAYDASNRLITQTDALGSATQFGYDAAGQITSVTDPLGHVTTKDYDKLGRLSRTTDPLGHATVLTYDGMGRLTNLKDANLHNWAYGYDEAGNQTSAKDPLNRVWTNTYDADNRLTKSVAPDGTTTAHAYDDAGRPTATDYSDGTSSSFSYDAAGQLAERTDASGTSSFTYDANGALAAAKDGLNRAIAYTYDSLGRLASRTQGSATTTFTYDPAGRLIRAADPSGDASWTYDAAGTLTGGTYPGGVTLATRADATHRLTGVTYSRAASTLFEEDVSYDAAGRTVSRDDGTGLHTYTYDDAGQLLSDTVGDVTSAWTYDNVGNRLSASGGEAPVSYTYDAADQLSTINSAAVQYDGRGNLTELPASDGTVSYTYDKANHMTALAGPAGEWSFIVDDEGTLLRSSGPTSSTYLVDHLSGRLLGQDGARTLVGAMAYGVEEGGSTASLLGDVVGTTRARAAAGGGVEGFDYSPWGELTGGHPGAGVPGYSQGVAQPDGTLRLGERVADPVHGRWTSPDPSGVREVDGHFGPYVYARNAPLDYQDPTGLLSLRSVLDSASKALSWTRDRARQVAVGATVLGRSTVSAAARKVSGVASNVQHAVNISSTLWDAFHASDGYVNQATRSRPSIAAQDRYGGAVAAPLYDAYEASRGDLQQLGVDRYVQCSVGSFGRTAATAGAGGQLAASVMTPQPKLSAGLVDKGVQFFTSLWTTADYSQRCYGS